MNEQNLVQLRELLVKEFNEEELVALCQDVGLNYAELPGMGPYGKTREIIEAAQAHHVIPDLMARVRDLRPDAYKAARLPDVETEAPAAATPLVVPPSVGEAATPPMVEPVAEAEPKAASPISALSPRTRAIAVVVAVVLLAVAALTIILPKPAATPAPAAVATAPEGSATPLFTAVPAVDANAVITPDVEMTATQPAAAPANATTDPNAVATASQSISESHPAAQAVTTINNQLLDFYAGKATADDIKPYWSGAAYQLVINFAYKTIKSKLGVDLARGKVLEVTMRYDQRPMLVSENGDSATVSTREYWGYTNPTTKRSICDTRDYTYTLVKNGDKYQITNIKSKLISAKCES